MRAIRIMESTGGPTLVETDAPTPQPAPNELSIRVFAAGVTLTELDWYPTSHTKSGEKRAGAVPGHEFSGVVAAGQGFEIGTAVYGMNDWFAEGALAEYCVAPVTALALKPSRLTHAEAASIPISALTAWQGLFDRAHLQPGERVLIHGGAGAVGSLAIQLAHLHGARVMSTASAPNLEFVASLGAEQVVDRHAQRFDEVVQPVDVVFDTAGGDTLRRSWSILKPGGRMVTIAASGEDATESRVKDAFFIVEPNAKQLTEIAQLLESGRLLPVVDTVVSLQQAADAFEGRIPRRGRGKMVVQVA